GATVDLSTWFESNNSKKYSFVTQILTHKSVDFYDGFNLDWFFEPNMRFNNKFTVSQSVDYNPLFNNMGYVFVDGSPDINFAKRKVNSVENILSAKYNFSNKMGITFR